MKYDVTKPADMLSLLSLVQTIGAYGDGGSQTQQAARNGEGIETYFSMPAARSFPALTSWGNDGQTIVLIEGVTTVAQGLGMYVSSSQSFLASNGVNVMAANGAAAVAFFRNLLSFYSNTPRRWVFAAHSWGGAIAEVLACYLLSLQRGDDIQVLTAGSPRPGDSTVRDVLNGKPLVRLMNPYDPIPHFPPHIEEAPVLTVAAGFAVALAWSRYVQPGGGFILDSSGGLTPAVVSPFGFPIYDATLTEWVLSTGFTLHPQHSLASYVAALSRVVNAQPTPPPPVAPLRPGERGVDVTSAVFASVTAAVETAQHSLPEVEVNMALVIPLAHRPIIRRVGASYWVTWEGGTVCHCATLSHARTIRKYLLKFLKTLDDAQIVYSAALSTAVVAFLTAASNPSGGFRPVLTVG